MSLADLKKQLKDKQYQSLYLFCGEEDFLKQHYFSMLKDAILEGALSDFNYMVFEGKQTDTDRYDQAIEGLPMMADRKLVLVKDSGIFKQTNEQVRAYWTKRLADIPDYICLVFYETQIDKRSALYKAVLKAGNVVECEYLSENEMIGWIGRACTKAGKKIEKDAADYLIACSDGSMNGVKRELEKLWAYCHEVISLADAKTIVSRHLQSRVFFMIDALLEKKDDVVFFELAQIKELGESAFGVLALLFNHFERLLHAKVLMDEGVPSSQLAAKMGINPYFAKKYIAGAQRFERGFLKYAASRCAEIDYEIKQGLYSDWDGIKEFLAKAMA